MTVVSSADCVIFNSCPRLFMARVLSDAARSLMFFFPYHPKFEGSNAYVNDIQAADAAFSKDHNMRNTSALVSKLQYLLCALSCQCHERSKAVV
eukprot:367273-Karenia_brevis.AAC.1